MKSKTSKSKSKVKKTISSLVLRKFKTTPQVKSKEMIELVKKDFPKSKFNIYHYSWYKHQIKVGMYKKQFDSNQLKSIFGT